MRAIDFMNVGLGALRIRIFNVADMAVMAGVVALILAWRRMDVRRLSDR